MQKNISLLIYIFVFMFSGHSLAVAKSASDVIIDTSREVLLKLETEHELIKTEPNRIYALVQNIVIPHFDFLSMSKWVLGKRNWHAASATQQEIFTMQFRDLLVRAYAKSLLDYTGNTIEYLSTEKSQKSKLVKVKTHIKRKDSLPIPIDYLMHIRDDKWMIVNVAISGVSLIAAYRSSFSTEIKKNGMDSLINKLSQKSDHDA